MYIVLNHKKGFKKLQGAVRDIGKRFASIFRFLQTTMDAYNGNFIARVIFGKCSQLLFCYLVSFLTIPVVF